MAGEERDARLILRAEDRATRTFDQVAASIKRVRQEIGEQSTAAREGTADLGRMQKQLEELKQAGDELVQGQSLIRQFDSLSKSVESADARLKTATAALETYRQKVGDNPTDNQANQLDKKTNAVNRAQANLDRLNQKLSEVTQRMDRAGISTDDTDKEFARLAASAVETAGAIAAVKGQIDDYPAAVQRAAAAMEELSAAQKLAGKDTSFLSPGEFEFIQSLDGAKAKLAALVELEQLEARSAATAAKAETQRRAEQRAAIDEVLRGNTQLEAQFAELAAESQRAKDLNAFRQIGTDAAESAVKVERYAASVQSLGNDFQSFSSQVRSALGGTQSALQDIGQALTQIDASAAVLDKPKVKINELQASSGKLAIAIATLDRTARQIDGFRQQEQAVRASEAAFAEAQQEVLRLARAVGEVDQPVEALANELTQAQRALNRAGMEMQRERNEAVKLGDALRKAGIDTDNLEGEMLRLQAGAQKAGAATEGLQGKLRGKGGFLGLNVYQIQNLGYQVNDVFTQLASGTGILQVLGQQGGQIIQIFEGLGAAILRALPLIAVVAIALAPVIAAISSLVQKQEALRAYEGLLTSQGREAEVAAAGYANAEIALRRLGASAEEARTAVTTFLNSGLDPSQAIAFAEAAQNAADVTGVKVPEAAKLLADALTGGVAQVEALNDQFHFLTAAEEEHITTMIESGNASEARRILFEKFFDKMEDGAKKSRGPWKEAILDLKVGWDSFIDKVANTGWITRLTNGLANISIRAVQALADISPVLKTALTFLGLLGQLKNEGAQARQQQAGQARQQSQQAPRRTSDTSVQGQRAIREATRAYDDQERSLKKLTRAQTDALARREALAKAPAGATDSERRTLADLAAKTALAKFDDDAAKAAATAGRKSAAAARKKENEAKRKARAAETLANQRRSIEEQLVRDLDNLDAKAADGQTQSIEARRKAVLDSYTGIFQKIEEAKRKGVTSVDGQSLQQYEAQVRAQIAILQNQAEMKAREEQINDVVKTRTDELKNIQDQLDRGDLTPTAAMQAFQDTITKFAPQITQMTNDALTFARSLRTATPDPKLEAFIARLERVQQQNSGGQDKTLLKGLDQKVIADEGKKLDDLVAQRDALVNAENNLVQLGVKSRSEAQASIEAAYARTNPLIAAQIEQMKALLASFVAANPEMQTFYDAWIAKLQGVQAQSQYVDARFTQIKSGIDQLITGNAVDGIDAIAQALANLAGGGADVVDTLGAIAGAFVNFIAQTILGIAKLILQLLILDAVQKITKIPIGALLKTFSAAGLHTGGIVGQERTFSRKVPEAAFMGAPRYHGGGLAGFAPDEVPAVLKRNEEVLTQSDPRHRFNLGSGGGGDAPAAPNVDLKVVNQLDSGDITEAGLQSRQGQRVLVNMIRANKSAIQDALR